eukprot:6209271-Pleurochrysis_carterae.AAC.1
MLADEKSIQADAPLVSMADFAASQMVAFYGESSVAARYLAELHNGLQLDKACSDRLVFFAGRLIVAVALLGRHGAEEWHAA